MRTIIASLICAVALFGADAAVAAEPVTVKNFTRVETDYYFKGRADAGCFARLCSERGPTPVDDQPVIRMNRDTPYSNGVFDLTAPLTIIKPDTGRRFQSMMVINEDHYIKLVAYKPGKYTLTQKQAGTRYVMVLFRTFMDPNDPLDMKEGQRLQDQIKVVQDHPGILELPDWDQAQRQKLHDALIALGPFVPDSRGMFGDKADVDPIRHLVGTAAGWGGNAPKDALYVNVTPKANDGQTAHTLTVKDVPVSGFWSITVYNAKGFYEKPDTAISVNNVTARKNPDASVTVHFGGDPNQPNRLRIMPGWNYTVRLYQPRPQAIEGKWTFPAATPVP
jgi:hypothetical protein